MDLRPDGRTGQAAGLTAAELSQAIGELSRLLPAAVRDARRLRQHDDLLLFLDAANDGGSFCIQLATDRGRARICTTAQRFATGSFATDARSERIAKAVRDAVLQRIEQVPDERLVRLCFARGEQTCQIFAELFGGRGLWGLLDGNGTILELSRLPGASKRELVAGATYIEPAALPRAAASDVTRFAAPVLAAIDRHFATLDQEHEIESARATVMAAIDRGLRQAESRIEGTARQLAAAESVAELRKHADLLLAYGFNARADASQIEVPDPEDPQQTIVLERQPHVPIHLQASKIYDRARRLEDSVQVNEQRRLAAERDHQRLQELRAAASAADDLADVTAQLQDLGLLPRAPRTANPTEKRVEKAMRGENFRRFASAEGYVILVGRTNQQNDKLSTSVARGNDLWFHVGNGFAGSHVVVRLPKGKTASLETMLDAGTLAIHFSKARQAARCDVIYAQAKQVRKPKGLPPGKVVVHNQKVITVRLETDRLQRLLDSAD